MLINDTKTTLRAAAEAVLTGQSDRRRQDRSDSGDEAKRQAHELDVHRIELELQNEELIRIQQELEESRNRYQNLYDFAPVSYLTLSDLGAIREANLTATRLFGLDRSKLLKTSLGSFTDGSDLLTVRRHLGEVIASGGRRTCEIEIKRTDGGRIFARLESVADTTSIGTAPLVRTAVIDVTESRDAQTKIDHLAERISLATSSAGVGIWGLDQATGVMVWSDVQCRLYGIQPAAFEGTREGWRSRVHPADIGRVDLEFAHALEGGEGYSSEFRILRPDGSVRTLRYCVFIQKDENGRPTGAIGTSWDITSYYRAMADLKIAKEQAEAASVAKSQFLANMSHELRTPLNSVMGFSELLLAREGSEDNKAYQRMVLQSAKTLLRMVEDVLDISKIECGKTYLKPVNFILKSKIDEVVEIFRAQANLKGLNFLSNISEDLSIPVHADHEKFGQVLINLIGNALKFTNQGRIEVSAEPMGTIPDDKSIKVSFTVRDTGIGIREENHQRIFESFVREDESLTARYGGTGLGLSIAKQLAIIMGGDITVQSIRGEGSCFTFTARLAPAIPTWDELTIIPSSEFIAEPDAKSILLVDDDAFSRELLFCLLKHQSYHVETAGNGAEALQKLATEKFDLILMDIRMPKMNGITVIELIRSGAVTGCPPGIPVIAVTAYAMPGDRERFLSAGMTDYIAKPIDCGTLLSALRRTLSSATPQNDMTQF